MGSPGNQQLGPNSNLVQGSRGYGGLTGVNGEGGWRSFPVRVFFPLHSALGSIRKGGLGLGVGMEGGGEIQFGWLAEMEFVEKVKLGEVGEGYGSCFC
jgi:hypothetical protein